MLPDVATVKLGPINDIKGKNPVNNVNEIKIPIILIYLLIISLTIPGRTVSDLLRRFYK